MKNLPKEKRDRLVAVMLGTLVILVAFWYGVISPQRKSLATLAKNAAEQSTKVANAERLIGSASQLQRDLEAARARLAVMEQTMASGDMYSWVISTLNSFKKGYKVEIPHFSRESAVEIGMFSKFPYRAVSFHLRGQAFYHDFGRFIADLENAFPYMRVQNIELEPLFNPAAPDSAGNRGDDPEKLGFRMEIVALVNPNAS